MKQYFAYIVSNKSGTLYTGMTNDLERRIWEHKNKTVEGFSSKYNITRLVWYQSTNDVGDAIGFEKKIKGWKRIKKVALIESLNPDWHDLAAGWYQPESLTANKKITAMRDPSVAPLPQEDIESGEPTPIESGEPTPTDIP